MTYVCRLLGISRSGFYEARKRAQVPTSICPVTVQLKASFAASGGCYGSRPLRKALHAKGMEVGIYKIRRLMRANGLRSAWKRKFVHTTDSKHDLPIAENVLNHQLGLIAHSDRGSQYASASYRDLLARNDMLQSMSRKGNCCIRPAKPSTQPCKAKTWCALKFLSGHHF